MDSSGSYMCAVGQESYEFYISKIDGLERIQYDYRYADGSLFSCVAKSLEEARRKKNKWLSEKST